MDKIITISREYGAGGHSIGQQVAKELGSPGYFEGNSPDQRI